MIMRLAMPALDASLRSGRVTRWLKEEGDSFGFGVVLCEVALDEFVALRRTARATLLSGRKARKLRSTVEVREGKVLLEVGVTSAEAGTMRKVLAAEGAAVAIGELLAVVSSTGEEDLGSEESWTSAPPLRCTANVISSDDMQMEWD